MPNATHAPQHEMAKVNVSVPTLVDREMRFERASIRSVFVQWFGESASPNMPAEAQFFFDTRIGGNDPVWHDDFGSFRVVFLGQIRDWGSTEECAEIVQVMGGSSLDATIAWLMSPKGEQSGEPMSCLVKVVPLGDPNVGVIRPRLYRDLAVRDEIVATAKAGMTLAEQLIANYRMELPPEDVPWVDVWFAECTCLSLSHSHEDNNPPTPVGGTCNDLSHVCKFCHRRWWQFNEVHHLWKHVTNPGEWDTIRRWQILKDAGYPLPGEGQ